MSRRFLSVLVSAAGLTLSGGSALGVLQGDGFVTGTGKYTAGNISGQNPFVPGFTSPWNIGNATNVNVVTTGLSSAAVSYETGGSVNVVGPTTSAVTLARSFTAPASSTYYFSVLTNRGNVNTINPGAYSMIGFTNGGSPVLGTGASSLLGLYIGYSQVGAVSSGGTLDDFGDLVIRSKQLIGGTNTGVDTILIDGQATSTFSTTYLTVARLDVNSSGTDLLTYWVNPTSLTSEAAMSSTALVSGSVTTNSISSSTDLNRLEFAENNFDGTVTFDEPRIATTLSDLAAATPVPEPAAAIVLAAIGTMAGRRHRRK